MNIADPEHEAGEPEEPATGTNIKGEFAPRKRFAVPKVAPTPSNSEKAECQRDNTPRWKKGLEIAAFVILLAYTFFAGGHVFCELCKKFGLRERAKKQARFCSPECQIEFNIKRKKDGDFATIASV